MKICLGCEGVTQAASARCSTCGGWLVPTEDVHYPTRRGEGEGGNPFLGAVVDGKYRLQAVLGRGGLGTVFGAQHVGSLLPVAIKLLHPRFAEQREYRGALLNEARRAASVMHERCARLLDVGETEDGVAYLAMELVDGDTLEEVLRDGPLPPGHVVAILSQVVEALVAIHAAGLVHCDLSPRNVMVVARHGRLLVKVLDFGIARTVSLGGQERTARSDLTGFFNPVFSAPEVFAGAAVDARADLYSLGMLARLMLTGSLPEAGAPAEFLPVAPRGVPRRLLRLVTRCLAEQPAARPADARAVARELAVLAGASRPAAARLSLAALGLVLVANLIGGGGPPPFLRSRPGNALVVSAPNVPSDVQHRRSHELSTVGLYFGGFRPADLRLEVSRGVSVLLRQPLRPEVEASGDALVLSTAQPQWREALAAIVSSSGDGDVDLAFVVPGFGSLAAARVRIDDSPPQVQWQLTAAAGRDLSASSSLRWQANDLVGIASVLATVQTDTGAEVRIPLTGASGELALGERLAAHFAAAGAPSGEPLRIDVVAVDLAGNSSASAPRRCALVDLAAPVVEEVVGPSGESFVPILSGVVRLRLRLSGAESGCRLQLLRPGGAVLVETALEGAPPWFDLEVPRVLPIGNIVDGNYVFVVIDPAGNRSERTFTLSLREQDLDLRLVPGDARPALYGNELVLSAAGAALELRSGRAYQVTGATFVGGDGQTVPVVTLQRHGEDGTQLDIQPTAPGVGRLVLTFASAGAAPLRYEVPTRILPLAIEVRVPETESRFLPGLLQSGVLASASQGLREGPGWRVDADLVAYLRGTVWIGGDKLVPLSLPARAGAAEALLPEILPVPGHNVFALELRDVLGAPARVMVGDRAGRRVPVGDHSAVVVADFWWHEGAPEVIGEVVLVEYGQPARIRLRLPIAYRDDELDELRLGLASEVVATSIVREGDDRCTVRFDLPFSIWSAGAGLGELARDRYGDSVERSVAAYLATPLKRSDLVLRLRTTRSTLRSLQLRELLELPPALAAITLHPVLAPAGEFAEPVPADAPPRAMFRPQVAVAVRNFGDFLLQEKEFSCGQSRALLGLLPLLALGDARAELVHAADPLGTARLEPHNLLPDTVSLGADDDPLTAVDFFQAYACCRVLGQIVGSDPDLFRLPLGCELELAAYAAAQRSACHGAAANGRRISAVTFATAAERLRRGERVPASLLRAAGDAVPTGFGGDFLGLDCGVREWVFDLPHVPGGELLLQEWLGDHGVHLAKCSSFARGARPPVDLAGTVQLFGVVRGLALGEEGGLLGPLGERLNLSRMDVLPDSVPGVLRTEQLRRDGRDLLSQRMDPRLSLVGFRLAGGDALVQRWRGRR